jgi:hypothetical protein
MYTVAPRSAKGWDIAGPISLISFCTHRYRCKSLAGDAENEKESCRGEERTRRHGSAPRFDTDAAPEKAICLFWTKSDEGTSAADLTETLGISWPSLYAAFGDKGSMFRGARSIGNSVGRCFYQRVMAEGLVGMRSPAHWQKWRSRRVGDPEPVREGIPQR